MCMSCTWKYQSDSPARGWGRGVIVEIIIIRIMMVIKMISQKTYIDSDSSHHGVSMTAFRSLTVLLAIVARLVPVFEVQSHDVRFTGSWQQQHDA